MKKVLIVSPYFPPVNAADMHRVRTSLPYFFSFGWEAEILTVDPEFSDIGEDPLLLGTIPDNIKVHQVKALAKKYTSRLGLGSIALRALPYLRARGNKLLAAGDYDLVYFSTTQFPVCVLGAYWKKKFGIPYVIDFQDPWHSEYYQTKPKAERPAKYWFSYRLNRYLEPIAVKNASGLISVSGDYISDLKMRYPEIAGLPSATITFGMFPEDAAIAIKNESNFPKLLNPSLTNLVYIGRGGNDMHSAIIPLFKVLKERLESDPGSLAGFNCCFIGTSYAPKGKGIPSILPLAQQFGLAEYVSEFTDRISFYHTLVTLQQADALFIPGSDDRKYTASKIYPYLMTGKPLLAIFNEHSSAISILKEFGVRNVYSYQQIADQQINAFLCSLTNPVSIPAPLAGEALNNHSAKTKTKLQCLLFEEAIKK